MEKYHTRRPERAINNMEKILEIIKEQRYMTLALCKENIPYVVTVSYAFDFENYCFYFHCAKKGRKKEFIESNPIVYGQILEDDGYGDGECIHYFKTVQFMGKAQYIKNIESKEKALTLLIEQQESNPRATKIKFINKKNVERTAIVRVDVINFSGKEITRK
ncbi:MAG: pyridoxamine 5'-phosphate oxidase family protein [Candidatus Odinarchaeia archaeon]